MPPAITRRGFLAGTGAAVLALTNLRWLASPAEGQPGAPVPAYRAWEDLYRRRWEWDATAKCTHNRVNCVAACSWDVYVKDGIVWREEQAAAYAQTNEALPDFNPRGCQKGACYGALMYSPARVKYPLKRAGERGEGRWRRISWEQALGEIADAIIDTCLINGPECICYDGGSTNADFGPDTAAEMRLVSLLGATTLDSNGAAVGDTALGAVQTWGMSFVDGTADDWMHADFLVVWCMNPSYTRIPEAHFLWEARYRGARVAVITPDYNATAMHADIWLNPKVGTDTALALAMAQVIVSEGLYRTEYVKEQTDLPFLVRTDTGCFLRERDLRTGGGEDVFYVWDSAAGSPRQAPGTRGHGSQTLRLGALDPALAGSHTVALADGRRVTVRPVFDLLEERLAAYTPEEAERITGVSAAVIRSLGREFARAGAATILASFGACKHFHSDLMQRAFILLAALTGNQGKRGGGLRVAAWWSLGGFEDLAAGHDIPFYLSLLAKLYTPSARDLEAYLTEFTRRRYLFTPALLWLHVHGGLAAEKDKGALAEALRRGWMPVYPRPGQDPRVLLCTGGNPLRRWPAPHVVQEHLWPKLKTIVAVNFRVSTTALLSDYILPCAAYYEKHGVKYASSYLPYIVVGTKAVEPLGEAKSEWEIFGLLARRIQEQARERGLGPYRDPLGLDHDLSTLYDRWSRNGELPAENVAPALDHVIGASAPTKGLTWTEAAAMGAVPIRSVGRYGPVTGVCSDYEPGKTVAPSRWFVDNKEPWPTLTGRQQFYLDHPWFIGAGEQLPCHKPLPDDGSDGKYPLRLTGGHTRWSIHAIWRDEPHLLRLQRGEPVVYIGPADAAARGVGDHDLVRVYNGTGECRLRAKISPAVQPGQIIIYHAWEPYQFASWQSAQNPVPPSFKHLHLVGDYGQLHFRTGGQAPGYAPRGTAVEVERAA